MNNTTISYSITCFWMEKPFAKKMKFSIFKYAQLTLVGTATAIKFNWKTVVNNNYVVPDMMLVSRSSRYHNNIIVCTLTHSLTSIHFHFNTIIVNPGMENAHSTVIIPRRSAPQEWLYFADAVLAKTKVRLGAIIKFHLHVYTQPSTLNLCIFFVF